MVLAHLATMGDLIVSGLFMSELLNQIALATFFMLGHLLAFFFLCALVYLGFSTAMVIAAVSSGMPVEFQSPNSMRAELQNITWGQFLNATRNESFRNLAYESEVGPISIFHARIVDTFGLHMVSTCRKCHV